MNHSKLGGWENLSLETFSLAINASDFTSLFDNRKLNISAYSYHSPSKDINKISTLHRFMDDPTTEKVH